MKYLVLTILMMFSANALGFQKNETKEIQIEDEINVRKDSQDNLIVTYTPITGQAEENILEVGIVDKNNKIHSLLSLDLNQANADVFVIPAQNIQALLVSMQQSDLLPASGAQESNLTRSYDYTFRAQDFCALSSEPNGPWELYSSSKLNCNTTEPDQSCRIINGHTSSAISDPNTFAPLGYVQNSCFFCEDTVFTENNLTIYLDCDVRSEHSYYLGQIEMNAPIGTFISSYYVGSYLKRTIRHCPQGN